MSLIIDQIGNLFNDKHLVTNLQEYFQNLYLITNDVVKGYVWDILPDHRTPLSYPIEIFGYIDGVSSDGKSILIDRQYKCSYRLNPVTREISESKTSILISKDRVKGAAVTFEGETKLLIHFPDQLVILEHQSKISREIFTTGGGYIYVPQYDNNIAVWDIKTFEFKRFLVGHERGDIVAIHYHGNTLYSISSDNMLIAWLGPDYLAVSSYIRHSHEPHYMDFYGFVTIH
jgi:WD40 repeat protein